MASPAANIPELFYSGNYKAVLGATIDSRDGKFADETLAFVIGALTFRGRLQEAETLHRLREAGLCEVSRFAARFFLGVGFCRISEYSRARVYFGRNLREGGRHANPRIRFFVWQGVGFDRLFFGKFRSGQRAAARALDNATEAGYLYGKALAADLMSHNMILPGQVSAALRTFDEAIEFARLLGDGGLVQAITVSRVVHSAQFGLDPARDLASLSATCDSLAQEDNYSKSRLLLEIARQRTLRGDVARAKEALDQACQLVYSSKNRRYGIMLNHRYAYLAYLAGDFHQALNLIHNARRELDLAIDRPLALEVWGLEKRVIEALNERRAEGVPALETATLAERIGAERAHGRAINHRVLEREAGTDARFGFIGDDPLGDLVDLCHWRKGGAAERVATSGFHGLFLKLIPGSAGRKLLHFDLLPDALIVIDRGQVTYQEHAASNIVRALARQLAGGRELSKQDLIERIWGYQYQALRHDSVIYRNISRFRALLGAHGDWLRATETGYQLAADVEVVFHQSATFAAPSHAPIESSAPGSPGKATPPGPVEPAAAEGLNLRQIKIVEWLRANADSPMDPRTCMREFGVSEVTARRDLSDLCERELLRRVGKGRATRYLLASASHPVA